MEVDQLAQGVPGGQAVPLLPGGELLLPLIALLGGGQGVVAVPYGEEEHRLVLHAVAGAEGRRIGQLPEGGGHQGHALPVQPPAGDVAAPLHEVEVVHLFHLILAGGEGLKHRLFRVVGQQHHVGQLQGGVLAHRHPGRNAGHDGALGGPHLGLRAGLVVVLLQIHHAHQAPAQAQVVQPPLHIDQAGGQGAEPLLPQVAGHGVVDLHDVGLHAWAVQAALGQDQAQGGWGGAHQLLHLLPVLRLGGVLVAGHHRPLGVITVLWQEDVRRAEGQAVKRVAHTSALLSPWPAGWRPAARQSPRRRAPPGGRP